MLSLLGIKRVSDLICSNAMEYSVLGFDVFRICQCSVSLRRQTYRGLYCSFCRSRHVRYLGSLQLLAFDVLALCRYFLWQDILQVIIPRTSTYDSVSSLTSQDRESDHHKCPICLSFAIAPRMTKCGHVCPPSVTLYVTQT
jgi:hypothetical protein